MDILLALLACVVAGFLNGSYAFPVKHIKALSKDSIWFYFSFLSFLIIPFSSTYLIAPNAFEIINNMDLKHILVLATGGLVFGFGMILFTLCLNKIGIGIAFIFNMTIGIFGGSLLPLLLFNRTEFLTLFGILNVLAFILFLLAMILCSYAIHLRDKSKYKTTNSTVNKNTLSGLILGIFAGILCAAQGFSYAYSLNAFKSVAIALEISQYNAILAPWVIIFSTTFVPYALFHLYLQIKHDTFVNIFQKRYKQSWGWLILMGFLYFSSVLIYSKAVLVLGKFGQIISWPLFMIFILLSSNFWSFIQGEWNNTPLKSKFTFLAGLLMIIFAILLLCCAAKIRLN